MRAFTVSRSRSTRLASTHFMSCKVRKPRKAQCNGPTCVRCPADSEDVKLPARLVSCPSLGSATFAMVVHSAQRSAVRPLDFAAPQGQVPQHLGGNQLNACRWRRALEVVDPKKLGRLNPIERNDLFHHILRLGTSVKVFFPDAARHPSRCELNDYALERLKRAWALTPLKRTSRAPSSLFTG